jgi:hypothetical protein
MALLGPREMSDLSPQSGPKQTLIIQDPGHTPEARHDTHSSTERSILTTRNISGGSVARGPRLEATTPPQHTSDMKYREAVELVWQHPAVDTIMSDLDLLGVLAAAPI